MTENNIIDLRSIQEWEAAIKSKNGIIYTSMTLRSGKVYRVKGEVVDDDKVIPVRWNYRGECYTYGRWQRSVKYDIKLPGND